MPICDDNDVASTAADLLLCSLTSCQVTDFFLVDVFLRDIFEAKAATVDDLTGALALLVYLNVINAVHILFFF